MDILKEIDSLIDELKQKQIILSECIKRHSDRPDNIIRIIEFLNNEIYDDDQEVH